MFILGFMCGFIFCAVICTIRAVVKKLESTHAR